jgi:hypothetical protein
MSVSLEHIPKELSITGVIDSAPQKFTVYVRLIYLLLLLLSNFTFFGIVLRVIQIRKISMMITGS